MDDPPEIGDNTNDTPIVKDNPSSMVEHVKEHYTSGGKPNENVDGSENGLHNTNPDEDNQTKSKDPNNPKPFKNGAKGPDDTVKTTDDLHSTKVDQPKNTVIIWILI